MKNKIITVLIIVLSIVYGIATQDYFLGTTILITGFLSVYYSSIGKICNFFFGAIFCLLNAYVSYKVGLNGIAILSILVYFPSQIHGYLTWKKEINDDDEVNVRGFTVKKSIFIVTTCIIGSILFSLLLEKLPNQQLSFLDASSNIINICGIVLLNLRYKEGWIVYLFNNIFDLSIWIINVINGTSNSVTMLIISIGYVIVNVNGVIKWFKMEKKKPLKN